MCDLKQVRNFSDLFPHLDTGERTRQPSWRVVGGLTETGRVGSLGSASHVMGAGCRPLPLTPLPLEGALSSHTSPIGRILQRLQANLQYLHNNDAHTYFNEGFLQNIDSGVCREAWCC